MDNQLSINTQPAIKTERKALQAAERAARALARGTTGLKPVCRVLFKTPIYNPPSIKALRKAMNALKRATRAIRVSTNPRCLF